MAKTHPPSSLVQLILDLSSDFSSMRSVERHLSLEETEAASGSYFSVFKTIIYRPPMSAPLISPSAAMDTLLCSSTLRSER